MVCLLDDQRDLVVYLKFYTIMQSGSLLSLQVNSAKSRALDISLPPAQLQTIQQDFLISMGVL